MNQPEEQASSMITPDVSDVTFRQEVDRLHQLTVLGRWAVVITLWLTVGTLSIWGLRYPLSLMLDYFTWSAVRYGLAFHRLAAVGLGICVGTTVAVLLWQTRNILLGLPSGEKKKLEQQVWRIRQQGPGHPLWKFVCKQ